MENRQLPYGPFMEEWRDVKDYEGLYQVSNYGRVKSLERDSMRKTIKVRIKERILKLIIDPPPRDYPYVSLYKNKKMRSMKVHIIMAEVFLGHVPCGYKLVVNHIFFDKSFNVMPYIEIVTQRENANMKHIKSSSKYTGVSWSSKAKKWVSIIVINGKHKWLGQYTNEYEAHLAYQAALTEHLKPNKIVTT